MWGDFGGLSVYYATFVDGERSTGLQQSVEAIQDRRTKHIIHDECNLLNSLEVFSRLDFSC